MNRRSFFSKIIGGVAITAAVRSWPFRVFSFPSHVEIAKPVPLGIKFIRAFDPAQSRMVNRWDMLYGFGVLESKPGDWQFVKINAAFPFELEKVE